MEEWAKTKEHRADTITLLCGSHHDAVTRKMLPREKVIQANNNPLNKNGSLSSSYPLYYDDSQEYQILLGDNVIKFSKHTVRGSDSIYVAYIFNQPLIKFTFEEGQIYLSCQFFDSDNKLILEIEKNELVYSVERWDITFIRNCLKINNASRDILLEIIFDAPSKLTLARAKMHYPGVHLKVNKQGVGKDYGSHENATFLLEFDNPSFGLKSFRGAEFRHCDCAILVGSCPDFIANVGIEFS